MSGEQTGAQLALQIQALVAQELARMGTHATLRIDGDSLVLGRGSAEMRAEIRGTLAQWESLPDDLRARRIQQIAGLLAPEKPARPLPVPTAGLSAAPGRALGLRWYAAFAPIAFALLTVVAIAVAYHYIAPRGAGLSLFGPTPDPSASSVAVGSADADRERFVLASTACAHTRTRVAQGANIGPADSEGWVVELTLLRRGRVVDLSLAPGLGKFVTRKAGAATGTLTWPPAAHLTTAQRFDAQVAIESMPPLGDAHVSGVDLVFSGPYVLAYFSEEKRSDYFRLANALAAELEATDGALFARCASGESHQIGSWFLGPSPGAAVASLVYFMASFSDVPLLKPSVLGALSGPPQRGHTFDAVNAAAADMNRSAAATLIGGELGMVSAGRDHATQLSFPFRDSNRATRASVVAARALKLADSG